MSHPSKGVSRKRCEDVHIAQQFAEAASPAPRPPLVSPVDIPKLIKATQLSAAIRHAGAGPSPSTPEAN